MSKRAYHPERGDVVHLNLAPSAGHELTGPHFALVISSRRFSQATGFAIVIPGTSKYHPDERLAGQQLMVQLPRLPEQPPELSKDGWLYPHQVKSLDYRDRSMAFVTRVDDDFLIDMMERVRAFIDPDAAV